MYCPVKSLMKKIYQPQGGGIWLFRTIIRQHRNRFTPSREDPSIRNSNQQSYPPRQTPLVEIRRAAIQNYPKKTSTQDILNLAAIGREPQMVLPFTIGTVSSGQRLRTLIVCHLHTNGCVVTFLIRQRVEKPLAVLIQPSWSWLACRNRQPNAA